MKTRSQIYNKHKPLFFDFAYQSCTSIFTNSFKKSKYIWNILFWKNSKKMMHIVSCSYFCLKNSSNNLPNKSTFFPFFVLWQLIQNFQILYSDIFSSVRYQEWMQAQQNEIKRILRGEISQIKESIENFGERLDSIQLIIRKSIEVSKTQDLETSTTSSSMTVTKKLNRGRKKTSSSNSSQEKNSSKIISNELLKSITNGTG